MSPAEKAIIRTVAAFFMGFIAALGVALYQPPVGCF